MIKKWSLEKREVNFNSAARMRGRLILHPCLILSVLAVAERYLKKKVHS